MALRGRSRGTLMQRPQQHGSAAGAASVRLSMSLLVTLRSTRRTSRTTSLSCHTSIRRADPLNAVRSGPAIQEAAGSRGREARECALPSRSTRSAGIQRCVWCHPGVALHRDGCANLARKSPTRRVRWRSWRLARTVGHADTLPTDRFRAVSMGAQGAP